MKQKWFKMIPKENIDTRGYVYVRKYFTIRGDYRYEIVVTTSGYPCFMLIRVDDVNNFPDNPDKKCLIKYNDIADVMDFWE